MSKEIIEEYIDQINESSQKDFPEILEAVVHFGFIDDLGLARLFDIELEEVEELLYTSEDLTSKEWKAYAVKLRSYMKREKAKYERMYYSERDEKNP